MTLILTIAAPREILHVSDRRVTLQQRGRPPAIHSPLENKTLIFLCKDAVAVMGYTGTAYIRGQPTDQWIANVLAPQKPGRPQLGEFVMGGRGMGAVSVQQVIWRLRNAVAAAQLPPGARFLEIVISGFRLRRHRCLPFSLSLRWTSARPVITSVMRRPRSLEERIAVWQIGDEFPDTEVLEHIKEGTKAAAADASSQSPLLAGMIYAVRVRAAQTPTVGTDLMTVVIPHPGLSRKIIWRFEPTAFHSAAVVTATDQHAFPAIYSPWIIGPQAVYCPTVSMGGMIFQAGSWTVECGNTDSRPINPGPARGRILFAASHHRRTRRP